MLKKFILRPGVNREGTKYTTEGGWYESEKVRFRQGTPEKIGGWQRISANTFLGICRSLWVWAAQTGETLIGVLTSLRQYVSYQGVYADISPSSDLYFSVTSFAATNGSPVLIVTDSFPNQDPTTPWVGAWVQFVGANSLGGAITASVLNNTKFIITEVVNPSGVFKINVGVNANSSDTGNGVTPGVTGSTYSEPAWSQYASQANFGSDLVYAYRGGQMASWNYKYAFLVPNNVVTFTAGTPGKVTAAAPYAGRTNAFGETLPVQFLTTGTLPAALSTNTTYYLQLVSNVVRNEFYIWNNPTFTGSAIALATAGTGVMSIDISAQYVKDPNTAANSPEAVNYVAISDVFRFVFAFGVNDYGITGGTNPGPSPALISPMLLRWCDQEDLTQWTPSATNQAGSLTLSRGSEIVTALQGRQEMVVWTDAAVYSLQYQGPPTVWGAQLVGENISIVSQNCVAFAAGTAFWMGKDKFYKYDGRVQTLRCDLRQYIFGDINLSQYDQVFAGTSEGFTEIWWFYCSAASTTIDRYAIYNYGEDIWYYGSLARTAWADSGLRDYPIAATYLNNIVDHEKGVDDNSTGTPAAITASITSAEFDVEDGNQFMFIRRVLPDLTFRGSSAGSPSGVLTLYPLKNSGSGYTSPASVGGSDNATVTRTATVPVEEFTGQVYIRLRARQLAMKFESTGVGVTWQMGAMRLDIRPDGLASGSGVSGG
jgi:hypothetical protein